VNMPGDRYKGKSIYTPTGASFLSALQQPDAIDQVHSDDTVLADELMGASYLVRGKWKLSQQAPLGNSPVFTKDVPFALYDISKDRGETKDLSAQYPKVLAEMKAAFGEYIRQNHVVEHAASYNGR
jgi:arylsulfatase A-like enzyme